MRFQKVLPGESALLSKRAGMSKQEPDLGNVGCQIQSVARICGQKGQSETVRLPSRRRMRLALRKRMSPDFRRRLKKIVTDFIARRCEIGRKMNAPADPSVRPAPLVLKAGDRVRVRSKQEIQSTLNPWHEMKGCGFMSEMWKYCGTTQRVLKPVERFVDERNYQVKKSRGIVLLEGVMCDGTEFYGKCDRSCFLFWREEWLERIDTKDRRGNPIIGA